MKFNYYYSKWILIGIIIIAAALRFFTLNNFDLNFEEQLIWFAGMQNTPLDALICIVKIKPFSLILAITSWITCYNDLYIELVNRTITLLSGIIAIPLIFILTKKIYSEIEGIIAAGFIGLSFNCIIASQNMTEQSLLLTFSLLYFIALITFLDKLAEEEKTSKKDNIFLIITGLLLGLTSIWGILIILISFFYSFFFIKKIKIFLKTICRFGYIIIPLGLFTWWGLYQNIIYADFKTNYLNTINYIISNNFILSTIFIAPIFYSIFIYIKRAITKTESIEDAKTKFSNSTLIISIWLCASIIGFILITLFMKVKFTEIDLIFILPPLFIFIARSIVLISSKLNHQIIIGSAFGLIFLISIYFNLELIDNKPEYNQATRYIMRTNEDNQYNIMFYGNNIFSSEAFTYYLKKNNIKNNVILLNDIKNANIDYTWFIADNSIDESIITGMFNKDLIIGGYRYKGVTIYQLKN